ADDAGNFGEVTTNVTPGAGGGSPAVGGTDAGPAKPAGVRPRQFTSSKFVNLKYSLQEVGKSGISVVEIWSTTDGRSWHRLQPEKPIVPREFDKPLAIPLTFDQEGLYGFTLVPRSGVG